MTDDRKIPELMETLAKLLDMALNIGVERDKGFVLLVFPHGDGEPGVEMVSNTLDQDGVTDLFQQVIAGFKRRDDGEAGHG